MSRIIHIVAVDSNGVIGIKNDLPFYVPEDLRNFKSLTEDSLVIIGFNTFKSIADKLAKDAPFLEGRKVTVEVRKDSIQQLHKDYSPLYPNVTFLDKETVYQLIRENREPVIIAGGNSLYTRYVPSMIIMTKVDSVVDPAVPETDLVTYSRFEYVTDPDKHGVKVLKMAPQVSSAGLNFQVILGLTHY